MKTRKSNRLFVLSIIITLAVTLFVALNWDWQQNLSTFANIQWGWLGIGLVVYFLNYIFRTLRFQTLTYTQNLPFLPLLAVTNLYGMFNYLLPAKTGEVSYIVLVNRRLSVSIVESTTTLVVARFLDFVAVVLFLPMVLLTYWQEMQPAMIIYTLVFCGVIGAIGVISYWFLSRRKSMLAYRETQSNWREKLINTGVELINGLITIHQRRQQIRLLLLTICIWSCIFLTFFMIVTSLGYQIQVFDVVIVTAIMIPLTLIPIQGFADLGTHEAGWVAAFTLIGFSTQDSLNIAVSSHIILLAFVLALGAFGLLMNSMNSLITSWQARQADH